MRISDWSSDVCSSDLVARILVYEFLEALPFEFEFMDIEVHDELNRALVDFANPEIGWDGRRNSGPAGLLFDPEEGEDGFKGQLAFRAVIFPDDGHIASDEIFQKMEESVLALKCASIAHRSAEHTYEHTSLMRNSYAVI